MNEIKTAFAAYGDKPFLFMWAAILYVFFSLVFFFAAVGLVLIGLIIAFVLGYEFSTTSPIAIALYALPALIAVLFYLFVSGGVSAAVVKTFKSALTGGKTSMIEFYNYGLSRSLMVFSIGALRDFFMLLLIAPLAAVYVLYLQDYQYMDIIFCLVVITIAVLFHLLAKPGIIATGLGDPPFDAFKRTFQVFKTKHIYFIGVYFVYLIVWVLNFVPLLQFISLFVLYPIVYAALIEMVANTK
ncbi:MAG: hypothetical protein V1492_01860 [Candidatus Micrarchaeota archaeon]